MNFKRNWGRLQVEFWKKKTVLNCKLRKKALHFFETLTHGLFSPQTCVSCPRVTTFEGRVGSRDHGLNQPLRKESRSTEGEQHTAAWRGPDPLPEPGKGP